MSFIKHTSRAIQTYTKSSEAILLDRHATIATILYRTCSSNLMKSDDDLTKERSSLSKAMKAFVERVDVYEKSMLEKEAEFDIGKRHLANMMGISMDRFTQMDVNKSIEYLFPSGLTHIGARPQMVPPREIYPRVDKELKFHYDGRPKNTLFYTGKPKYYKIMQKIGEEQIRLDSLMQKGEHTENLSEESQLMLGSTTWMPIRELSTQLEEFLLVSEYEFFVASLTHLCQHPLSKFSHEFIMKYRVPIINRGIRQMALILLDEGRQFTFDSGQKKNAHAVVKVYRKGTGKFTINRSDILFFEEEMHRKAVVFPLLFTNLAMKVDVHCTIGTKSEMNPNVPHRHHNRYQPNKFHKWGSAYATSIRLGLSRALLPFVDEEMQERMRVAGLLTYDHRTKERKKPGQPKARKKPTWKAR